MKRAIQKSTTADTIGLLEAFEEFIEEKEAQNKSPQTILKEYIRKWRYDVGGDAWLFPNIGGEQLMGEWTPLRVQAVLSEPGREAAQCAWSAAYLFALLYKK